jgi:DNA-binding response OmpR family regulator
MADILDNKPLYDSSILIVDYNPLSSQELSGILAETGYQNILPVNNSKEVLKIYRDKKPDLTFLDLRMPGLGGVDVLDDLKTLSNKPHLPVIVLSDRADLKIRLTAFKWGIVEFLGQPYDVNEVRFRARNVLNSSQ